MKKILFFACIVLALSACDHISGSGNIITQTRNTGDFTGVEAGGAFEVEIRSGDKTEVRVEADDNLIDLVETRVSGNTLHISTKSGTSINDGRFKVFITAPDIDNLTSTGAASIDIKNVLKNSNKITLEATGAANIKGEIDAPEVSAEASGAAEIKVSGRTKTYHAEASGSGTVKTSDLMSETAKVHASGAGSVYTYASISVDADADGAGSIHYKGAGQVTSKTSGAGNVKKDD